MPLFFYDFSRIRFSETTGDTLPRRQRLRFQGLNASDTGEEIVLTNTPLTGLQANDLSTTPGLVSGEVKAVDGFSEVGDGGEGLFRWTSGTPAVAEDGYIRINATGGQWKRMFDGSVYAGWFGANGDGVTDNTTGVHAAINYAKSRGLDVRFAPGRVYRVTSGFTQSTLNHNIVLRGGTGRGMTPGTSVATILLDSASGSSCFLNVTAQCTIMAFDLTFKTAQFVQDRDFFRINGPACPFFIERCMFQNVDRPIVLKPDAKFQNAAVRDVTFNSSGTIHSEITGVGPDHISTFLRLSNINHEGTTPANTEKVLMNLQGIRGIAADILLLEGSLPASGWTALKLSNTYDAEFIRYPTAQFTALYFEFSGTAPDYIVNQSGGTVLVYGFDGFGYYTPPDGRYRVTESGRVLLYSATFPDTYETGAYFSREDDHCTIELFEASCRNPVWTDRSIIYHDALKTVAGLPAPPVSLSTNGQQEIWRYRGGYVEGATLSAFTGTAVPSTDATYGRMLLLTPAAGVLDVQLRVACTGTLQANDQVIVCIKAKLPTYASGSWAFTISTDDTADLPIEYFDSTYSGATVDVILPVRLEGAPTYIGAAFTNGTVSGAVGTVDVYSIAVYHGKTVPTCQVPVYPAKIVTFATAAPATGTWAVGDIVKNSAPSVGQPKGWMCTVAGTPGTWVSEGNL